MRQIQRIWVLSDLHMELTRGWDLPAPDERPEFDVLVIAGDLTTGMERGVAWIQERVTDRPVVYIAGNHEAYGADIDRTVERARAAAADTNVHVLQNEAVVIGGTTFIGATLWTDFSLFGNPEYAMAVAGEMMNDYRKIRVDNYELRLRPAHTLARHIESRDFIVRELQKSKTGPRVVATHHRPHPSADLKRDLVSAAYASDLSDVIAAGTPDVWIYGHTHECEDRMIGSTRMITNAKGYGPWLPRQTSWDNPDFDPHFVIEIGGDTHA